MASAPVQVTYDVRRAATHLVRVRQRVPATDRSQRTFWMPNWVAGSYKILDLGRHVQDLTVTVGGKPGRFTHPTKDSWVVDGTRGKPVELTYDVYARDLTVDTSHVTADHAHLFPVTLTLYEADSRPRPHKVRVLAPPGWRTWSGLETPALNGTLEVASSYDHLIDCPIEVGPPEDYHVSRFKVRGKWVRHVCWRPPADAQWARLDKDMAAIVNETAKVFGGVPYEHYTFLTHVAQDYGGGLEHRNSTVLGADPNHLAVDEKIQTRFLPLVAHEFFHTWNVKRMMPKAFQPYDLQREVYTDLLWLFEGFTSYYELPILYRAKLVDDDAFAKMVGEDLEMYHKASGRKRRPVGEASRLTWVLLYQPHEHNVNRNVSYYTKGMWVALCVDAELRRIGVRDGLDRVMRHIWQKHGKTGQGVPEGAFADLVHEATGVDLRRKLKVWIDGTDDLPIEASLKTLGWSMKQEWKDAKRKLGLGVEFKPGTQTIARIWDDVPAFEVLQPDDEVVAAHGYRWRSEHFHDHSAAHKEGDVIDVAVFREGRLRQLRVPLTELPKEKFIVSKRKGDAASTRRRVQWIGEGRPPKKDKSKRVRHSPKAHRKGGLRKRPA